MAASTWVVRAVKVVQVRAYIDLNAGINGTGQVPEIPGNHGLIDKDTPADAMTWTPITGQGEWQLVFSDEFETEDRTFYPGDDPYWEAVDLHYWGVSSLTA